MAGETLDTIRKIVKDVTTTLEVVTLVTEIAQFEQELMNQGLSKSQPGFD